MIKSKFTTNLIQCKDIKNSFYFKLRHEFLYHSNKIEGSTFTTESLALLLDKNIVEGKHSLDDIQETVNSSYVFDTIIETLYSPVTEGSLKNLHSSLMYNTTMHHRGFSGVYKTIPNMIIGTSIQLAQPYEVQSKIDELLENYYSLDTVTIKDIAEFHVKFELIHPFQDGNGRIGRFLMLKQLLENNLPLYIISWDTEDLYRVALSKCTENNVTPLVEYLQSLKDFKITNRIIWDY